MDHVITIIVFLASLMLFQITFLIYYINVKSDIVVLHLLDIEAALLKEP